MLLFRWSSAPSVPPIPSTVRKSFFPYLSVSYLLFSPPLFLNHASLRLNPSRVCLEPPYLLLYFCELVFALVLLSDSQVAFDFHFHLSSTDPPTTLRNFAQRAIRIGFLGHCITPAPHPFVAHQNILDGHYPIHQQDDHFLGMILFGFLSFTFTVA